VNITIRKAELEDIPSILSLYAEIDFPGEESLSPEKARYRFLRIQSYPDYNIYVAVHEGQVVGTFALLIMDNLAHSGASSAVIEDVVVGKDWQRHGIGKQMMDYAMRRCRKAECYKLMFSSNATRKDAHKFYEALGFKRHGYSFRLELEA
jgi:GNAT superfamily N-acetyltransferase